MGRALRHSGCSASFAAKCLGTVGILATAVAASNYRTRYDGTTWDDDLWRLQTTTPDPGHYQSRAIVANGYIGINVASLGPFFEVDTPVNGDNIAGWPLFDRRQSFATVAGFYDSQPQTNGTNFPWLSQYGGESIISGIPHWAGIHVLVDGSLLSSTTNSSEIAGFSSTYDYGAGLVSWRYTWTPSGKVALDIEYSLFAHKLYINQAVTRLKVTPARSVNLTVIDVLNGDSALRTQNGSKPEFQEGLNTIWTSVTPVGIDSKISTAYIYSVLTGDAAHNLTTRRSSSDNAYGGHNDSSIAQEADVSLQAGDTLIVDKFVGIAAGEEQFHDPSTVACDAARNASKAGYVNLLNSHIAEWQSIMTPDSVDSYRYPNGSLPDRQDIIDQQILAITSPYYMLQNTVSMNALNITVGNKSYIDSNSISVGGLGSDAYAGQIFWDAEVFMQPGLVVSFPHATQQIANYRYRLFGQAKENIKTAYQSSQNSSTFSDKGAIFPWTSGRYGNCTAVGPCWDYEYHINGDIGIEIENYCISSGDRDSCMNKYFPIYEATAYMYADLVRVNASTGLYSLQNATDPDEFANHVNNAAYTMVLIGQHLNRTNRLLQDMGSTPNDTWSTIARSLAIPVDDSVGLIREFEGMDGTVDVKQADVVLVDDLLDYPNPYTLADLDFYAGRQSSGGPAMTFGVFSNVASAASPSGCSAFTYQRYGAEPYLRGPWYQFSEQLEDNFETNGGFHPAYPFLTGMGGANSVAILGYLGYRFQLDSFNVNPSMPPQILNLRYRTVYWYGHGIRATANQTHTVLERLPLNYSLPYANSTYATAAIPITVAHSTEVQPLSFNSPITLPNRRASENLTVAGNVAQCKDAYSSAPVRPGQFAIAAIDGAVSTAWQPNVSTEVSTLVVDLGDAYKPGPVRGIQFDWAQDPPSAFNVSFSNSSDFSNSTRVCGQANVTVSMPTTADSSTLLTRYMSNTTNVSLADNTWSGRYAFLTVIGNQAYPGSVVPGPSVAEFVVVAGTPASYNGAINWSSQCDS